MPKEECDSVLFEQVGVRITLEFCDNTFNNFLYIFLRRNLNTEECLVHRKENSHFEFLILESLFKRVVKPGASAEYAFLETI